jgi:hypothetical protein
MEITDYATYHAYIMFDSFFGAWVTNRMEVTGITVVFVIAYRDPALAAVSDGLVRNAFNSM